MTFFLILNLWRMAILNFGVRFEVFGGLNFTSRRELVVVLCLPSAYLPGDYWILGQNSQTCPTSGWITTTIFMAPLFDSPPDF